MPVPRILLLVQRLACSGLGAPALAQPVQLASLEVVTQASSSIGLPQYVSLIWGLATCTLPIPLAWRMFIRYLLVVVYRVPAVIAVAAEHGPEDLDLLAGPILLDAGRLP